MPRRSFDYSRIGEYFGIEFVNSPMVLKRLAEGFQGEISLP